MANPLTIAASCLMLIAFVSCGMAEKGSSTAGTALPEWESSFTFKGKPIHPAIIHKFVGWLSDSGPIVVAVDVAAAEGTNEYSMPITLLGDSVGYVVPDTDPQELYGYRWVGRMADGTHVVIGTLNSGGTGRFGSLLFFRFSVDDGYAVPRDPPLQRVILSVTGWHPIGDRANPTVQIVGDHVEVIPRSATEDQFAENVAAATLYPSRKRTK